MKICFSNFLRIVGDHCDLLETVTMASARWKAMGPGGVVKILLETYQLEATLILLPGTVLGTCSTVTSTKYKHWY